MNIRLVRGALLNQLATVDRGPHKTREDSVETHHHHQQHVKLSVDIITSEPGVGIWRGERVLGAISLSGLVTTHSTIRTKYLNAEGR